MTPVTITPSARQLRILLLGKNGQVGFELARMLPSVGEVHAPDRAVVDLTNPDSIRNAVATFKPDIILNAAAYTAVDKAESEPKLAAAVNADAPAVLAKAARAMESLLIHYSTDYVFDGSKPSAYREDDAINPLNVYGHTKAAGEDAIVVSGCDHLILRTSWIFSPRNTNFLLTMLRLGKEKRELRIVNDQRGAPTSSASIAGATLNIVETWKEATASARNKLVGLYHLTSSGQTSWFEFASEIFRNRPNRICPALVPVTSAEYPTPARRPLNSHLDCGKLTSTFGIEMPHWRESLVTVMHEIGY